MKKIFVLMALSSFAMVSADRWIERGSNSGPDYSSGWGDSEVVYESGPSGVQWSGQGEWSQPEVVHRGGMQGWVGPENYHQESYGQSQVAGYGQSQQQGYVQQGQHVQYGHQQNAQQGEQSQWEMPGFQRLGAKYQVSDQELAKKIYDALASTKDYNNVNYRVDEGVVVVRGPVSSLELRQKLEDAIKKIEGVRHVNNQVGILVVRESQNQDAPAAYNKEVKAEAKYANDFAATDADKQLNAKIRNKLSGGWFSKGYDALVIRTTNGVVVITGAVDSQDDLNKIADSVKGVEGVRNVNVQVAVKKK